MKFARVLAVAAAAGIVFGGTTLAVAAGTGGTPGNGQGHGVERSTEGCPDGRSYPNHGAYVSEVAAAGGDVEAASQSPCGKPVQAGQGGDDVGEAPAPGGEATPGEGHGPKTDPPHADDPCKGPPPWARGAGKSMSPEDKDAAKAARAAQCGTDDDAAEATESPEAPEAPEAPEGTEPPEAEPGAAGQGHGRPDHPGKSDQAGKGSEEPPDQAPAPAP